MLSRLKNWICRNSFKGSKAHLFIMHKFMDTKGKPNNTLRYKQFNYINIPRLHYIGLNESGKKGQIARQKIAVLEKYGYKCAQCPQTDYLTIDHIKSANGDYSQYPTNDCQVLCVDCHIRKNVDTQPAVIEVGKYHGKIPIVVADSRRFTMSDRWTQSTICLPDESYHPPLLEAPQWKH